MHFCVLLLPFLLLLALLEGQSCLVLGGKEVETHSLRCVQNLVDHLDFISPPIAVLQLSPAHVKLQPVSSNIFRATGSPLLRRNHAQHLLIRIGPLLVHIVGLSRHFLEVAGSLMEQGVQPGILEHLPGLLLQKPHLFSDDCELAARDRRCEPFLSEYDCLACKNLKFFKSPEPTPSWVLSNYNFCSCTERR